MASDVETFGKATGATSARVRRRMAGIAVAVLVLIAVVVVAIPFRTILPFKSQTPEGVSLSYTLTRWGPAVTLAAALAALALAAWLWRGARWWTRTALVLALVPLAAAVAATRFNRFEKMFAPLPEPRFAAAPEASWMDPAEMVLAIEIGGEAVAYPVRQIAYHHVVQDVVGGVPVVATY